MNDVFLPGVFPDYHEYSDSYKRGYVAAIDEYLYCLSYCKKKLEKKKKKILDNKKMVVRYGGVKGF